MFAMSAHAVEILYFEGCPNLDETAARVRAAIAAAEAQGASIRPVQVTTVEAAQRVRFLGSPSVRVDGVDVDPSAGSRTDFGLQCRVYEVGGRLEGAPPLDWIRRALTGEAADAAGSNGLSAAARSCCARSSR